MKSGTKKHIIKKVAVFNFGDYKDAHQKPGCSGKWQQTFTVNDYYSAGALGPVRIPAIPYIHCPKCEATFLVPGFQAFIEEVIATHLVLSKGLLDKKQLRFLRQYFDLSQEKLAEQLGVGDRFYMSKYESGGSTHHMPADVQFKLKILYAKMLGIDSTDSIYKLLEQQDKYAEIQQEDLPPVQEIKKHFAVG